MIRKPKDLEAVLRDIRQYMDNPLSWVIPMSLIIWVDTKQEDCSPILAKLVFSFYKAIYTDRVFDVIRKIDKETPITAIRIEDHIFHISKTEKFANKRCEV